MGYAKRYEEIKRDKCPITSSKKKREKKKIAHGPSNYNMPARVTNFQKLSLDLGV